MSQIEKYINKKCDIFPRYFAIFGYFVAIEDLYVVSNPSKIRFSGRRGCFVNINTVAVLMVKRGGQMSHLRTFLNLNLKED